MNRLISHPQYDWASCKIASSDWWETRWPVFMEVVGFDFSSRAAHPGPDLADVARFGRIRASMTVASAGSDLDRFADGEFGAGGAAVARRSVPGCRTWGSRTPLPALEPGNGDHCRHPSDGRAPSRCWCVRRSADRRRVPIVDWLWRPVIAGPLPPRHHAGTNNLLG